MCHGLAEHFAAGVGLLNRIQALLPKLQRGLRPWGMEASHVAAQRWGFFIRATQVTHHKGLLIFWQQHQAHAGLWPESCAGITGLKGL